MIKPMFSVIIPTLNEEKFIGFLLESLVKQTEKNFEVVVVDGSSKDKTVEIASSFQKQLPKLRVIVSKKANLPLQRNLGAKEAHGDWFVFVDADSVLLPYFFERVGAFIAKQKPKLFTTWFRPDTNIDGDALLTSLFNLLFEGAILLHRPFSPGPLTIVYRSAFNLVSGYDERHTFNEDIDFGFRLEKRGIHLRILPETLCVLSLRRFRKEGTGKVLQQYLRAALPVLILKRPLTSFPGYIMGGQLYGKRKQPFSRSLLRRYEIKLKRLLKEFFTQ